MKRTAYNPDTATMRYMNNTGHRAISIDADGNRPRVLVKWSADAQPVSVAVKHWASLGNWSVTHVRQPLTGRIVPVYPDSDVDAAFFMPYDVKYPQA